MTEDEDCLLNSDKFWKVIKNQHVMCEHVIRVQC